MRVLITGDTHYGHTDVIILRKFWQRVLKERPDVVVHCGDWASTSQYQLEMALKQARAALGKTPIVCVMGNHDYWNPDSSHLPGYRKSQKFYETVKEIERHQRDVAKAASIHFLTPNNPFIKDNVYFAGFTGWYGQTPPSNDLYFMPGTIKGNFTHDVLTKRADADLSKILSQDMSAYRKRVCVTHFGSTYRGGHGGMCSNRSYDAFISDQFDYLMQGHSHLRRDEMIGNCRLLNSGSDYGSPKYIVIDV